MNSVIYYHQREKQLFSSLDLAKLTCSVCFGLPSVVYAPTKHYWFFKPWPTVEQLDFDFHFCEQCEHLFKIGDNNELKKLYLSCPKATLRGAVSLPLTMDLVRSCMDGRQWLRGDDQDYRFGYKLGLEIGSLPKLAPLNGHKSDMHAELLSAPMEIDPYNTTRKRFASIYSWAIPTRTVLERVAALSPSGVVDYGAGTGYWSALLASLNCNVRSIDLPRSDRRFKSYNQFAQGEWLTIDRDVAGLNGTADMSLLLVWPPENSDMADQAIKQWGGRTLFYVGEWSGGVTATPAFFTRLKFQFRLLEEYRIPTFFGYFDKFMVFERL